MKKFFLQLIIALFLLSAVFCSLPSSKLKLANKLIGVNSINGEHLQEYILEDNHFRNNVITGKKLKNLAVEERHLTPNSVSAKSLNVELVRVFIRGNARAAPPPNDITRVGQSAFGIDLSLTAANDATIRRFRLPWQPQQNNVNFAQEFKTQTARAKGPGIIIGWYPSQNGHLLRYQADRALRNPDPQCRVHLRERDINSVRDFFQCSSPVTMKNGGTHNDGSGPLITNRIDCTKLGNPPNANPVLESTPLYLDCPTNGPAYGTLETPRSGTPILAPAIERITIDATGKIEVVYAGKGQQFNTPRLRNMFRTGVGATNPSTAPVNFWGALNANGAKTNCNPATCVPVITYPNAAAVANGAYTAGAAGTQNAPQTPWMSFQTVAGHDFGCQVANGCRTTSEQADIEITVVVLLHDRTTKPENIKTNSQTVLPAV